MNDDIMGIYEKVHLVAATIETEADLVAELEKFAKNYVGGKGVDVSKFPDFKWGEPVSVICVNF